MIPISQRDDPECWSWPVPEPRAYATEEEAEEALAEWQRFRGCAICGFDGVLVEDHDHKTGLVRGQLCHTCNIKEGKGSQRPPFVKYRERHPAAILGVRVRYWSSWTGYAEPTVADPDGSRKRKAAIDTLTLPRPEDLTQETTDA